MPVDEFFNANQGNLFVQPHGPNTQPVPLGCHTLGDVTEPGGDVAQSFCPDPSTPGKWRRVITTQGPPDRPTTSIETLVGKIRDQIEKLRCPFPIYVHNSQYGRKDVFMNFDRGVVLQGGRITSRAKSNLASRDGSDPATQSIDFSLDGVQYYTRPLRIADQATAETQGFMNIAFCNAEQCAGAAGQALDLCTTGYLVAMSAAGPATANMYYTADGGNVWGLCATDPFIADEHISGLVCFDIDRSTSRVLVARGTTDGANPAEVAYSDDQGTTWARANLGISPAQDAAFVMTGRGMFALNYRFIFAVTDLGDIFKSTDGGVSWAEIVTTNTDELQCIHFADEYIGLACGETNTILYTEDGGEHWTALVGDAAKNADDITCCWVFDASRYWVGYDDGEIWYTVDGGATWAQRVLPVPAGLVAAVAIRDMKWIDEYCGYVALAWTGGAAAVKGSVYRTINGGWDWEQVDLPTFTAAGLAVASLAVCGDYDKVHWCGSPTNALGTVGIIKTASA